MIESFMNIGKELGFEGNLTVFLIFPKELKLTR